MEENTENSEKIGKYYKLSAQELCSTDPLASLLYKISPESVGWILLLVYIIYGILAIGLGSLVSIYYERSGTNFISILDYRELPSSLLLYLLIIPPIWLLYYWQPKAFSKIFDTLIFNDIIISNTEDDLNIFLRDTERVFKSKKTSRFIYGFVILAFIIWLLSGNLSPETNPQFYGQEDIWFHINPYYFWFVWIPIIYVNVYIVGWVIARQLIGIWRLNSLFTKYSISLKPFHPDKCNGLAQIGEYALNFALIVLPIGVWVCFMIIWPTVWGNQAAFKIDNVLYLAAYVITVPVLLITPTRNAHLAMKKAKAKELEFVAIEIRNLLSTNESKKLVDNIEIIEKLEKKYDLLDKELVVWPFKTSAIRQFSIISTLPVLISIFSFVMDYIVPKSNAASP